MEFSVRRPSPPNTYSYVREENSGSTREFIEIYLLFTCISNLILAIHMQSVNGRVASQFGISVRHWSVFSRYFTNQYQRKTWPGRFGIVHLAGTPFFPQREASAPFLMDQAPLLRGK